MPAPPSAYVPATLLDGTPVVCLGILMNDPTNTPDDRRNLSLYEIDPYYIDSNEMFRATPRTSGSYIFQPSCNHCYTNIAVWQLPISADQQCMSCLADREWGIFIPVSLHDNGSRVFPRKAR